MAAATKTRTKGKGVTLRRHGNPETGAFVVMFRDPRYWQNPKDPSKGRKVVRRSLKTHERVYAEKCTAALERIINDGRKTAHWTALRASARTPKEAQETGCIATQYEADSSTRAKCWARNGSRP